MNFQGVVGDFSSIKKGYNGRYAYGYKENSTNCYFSIYLFGWETLVIDILFITKLSLVYAFGVIYECFI